MTACNLLPVLGLQFRLSAVRLQFKSQEIGLDVALEIFLGHTGEETKISPFEKAREIKTSFGLRVVAFFFQHSYQD